MTLKDQMNTLYRDLPLNAIPWNLEHPPRILTGLVDSGWVKPCTAVDLGCGAGNYVVWLASHGFQMTGLDLSDAALELARDLATEKGVDCRFECRDMTRKVEGSDNLFEFAYDWDVLHHIFPEHRATYVENVHYLLKPGGKYLSVCFHDSDPAFGGKGKYRDTPMGTTLYFSSEEELLTLFGPLFQIEKLTIVEIEGKREPHKAVKALMTRRGI
ncbi:class I SAM-dependent methyltransferase [Candidatus Zixiibacteriota bacterium]